MQQIAAYVMAHYVHAISLKEIAAEVGMNRSAFCSYFKRCKGMTFSQFVTQYRLNTACELLKHSQKQVSGDLLPGRVQRRSAFQPHVQKGETHVSQSVQERRIDKKPLTVLFSGEKPYLCIRKRLLPMEQDKRAAATLRLLKIMDELREKCPWDRKQTFETLRGNTIEETYELADAILDRNMEGIREELGEPDAAYRLLLRNWRRSGAFDYADVVMTACANKLSTVIRTSTATSTPTRPTT